MRELLLAVISIAVCSGSSVQFLSHPVDKVVTPESSVYLHCNVTGSVTTVNWFRSTGSSIPLTNGSNHVIYINGSLRINSFTTTDNGGYYCVASSSHGSVRSMTAQLQTAVIQSLNTVSTVFSVDANSPLSLNCTLPHSIPPVSVTWYRGSDPVTLGDRIAVTLSHTLVFSYTVSSDHAPYSCRVSNDLITGSEYTANEYLPSINAVAVSNPVISLINDALPVSQTVTGGMQAQIQCFATGRPIPNYSWSRNGTVLAASQRISFSPNNRILTISNLTQADTGDYQCTVTQGNTQVTRNAFMSVIDPVRIVKAFDQVVQFASLSVNISCTAQGTAPIRWLWRNNTQLLEQSSVIQFTETGPQSNLTINSLDVYSNGTIQCVASNGNSQSSANNDLIVQTKSPSFTTSPQDTFVFTNNLFTLSCAAISYPYPRFSWIKNSQQLSITNRHSLAAKVFNGTLTVSSAAKSDNGGYQCAAEGINGVIVLSNTALVRVIDEPNPLIEPSDQIVLEGHEISVSCSLALISDVNIRYVWTQDNHPLDTSDTSITVHSNGTLTIRDFNASRNAGLYRCAAVLEATGTNANSLNYEIGSAFLSTVTPTVPSPPHSLVADSSHNASRLSWSAPDSNGGLTILEYRVQVTPVSVICPNSSMDVLTLSTTTLSGFVVGPLKPFSLYSVIVLAVNSRGSSNASDSIVFQTEQSIPSLPPSNVSFQESDKVGQLLVTWSPPPCEGRNGIITNYTVQYWINEQSPLFITLSDNNTNVTLTQLQVLVQYNVQIAANTDIGKGPFSDTVSVNTSMASPPNPPRNVSAFPVNCTQAVMYWNASMLRDSERSTNASVLAVVYLISHTTNETINNSNSTTATTTTSYTLSGLQEGSVYLINISARNAFGQSDIITVILTLPYCPSMSPTSPTVSPTPNAISAVPLYKQSWFIYSVSAGGGGIILALTVICLCCICCLCVKKRSASKSFSPSTRSGLHFTYPNRRSTVLDRMMQVEAMNPKTTRQSAEYAELDAIRATIENRHSTENGTLSSQGSTLRSRYQYKSPMEQEEERQQLRQEEETNNSQPQSMPEVVTSTLPREPSSSRISTAQRNRLFQSRTGSRQAVGRPGSTSPTDTVSSFEYESHSQIAAKIQNSNGYQFNRRANHETDYGYAATSSGDERRSPSVPHYHHTTAAVATGSKRPPTFKKLPDLALMTAITSSSNSSPTLSNGSSSRHFLSLGNNGHKPHLPPPTKAPGQPQLEEEHYQTPRLLRHNVATLPLSTQTSLV